MGQSGDIPGKRRCFGHFWTRNEEKKRTNQEMNTFTLRKLPTSWVSFNMLGYMNAFEFVIILLVVAMYLSPP